MTNVDVAIVGGGLAGLAAAWHAQQEGLSYVLLERSGRLGGKALSEQVWGYGDTPFTIEYGPDGFITRKPWAMELAQAVDAEITPVRPLPERIYVLSEGELHPIPDGLYLLVPTKIRPLVQSGLFSLAGKLRMLAERFVPAKTDVKDESVADYIRRRLGVEALDKLGEPLLAGVYNADVEQMSMHATFKQFPALEREHGSLSVGMRRKMRHRVKGGESPPALVSMLNGMGALADAVAERLTGDVRTDVEVESIQAYQSAYVINTDSGTVDADNLILATSAATSASLVDGLASAAAESLREIRYEGVGSMALAYRSADIPRVLDAYGIVIPGSENRSIDGITFASAKWDNRAPEGYELLRVFFGGPNTRHLLGKSDSEVLDVVRGELHEILGITAEPVLSRIRRWAAGYPQYDVGHLERVAAIRKALPAGIHLTGLAYDGVGIPDTVRGARNAVRAIKRNRKEKV